MRFVNWPELLNQFVLERRSRAFEWGINDCASFASDWVEIATGRRLFSPEHRTAAGAIAEVESRGCLVAAVTELVGPQLSTPRLAQRGDIGHALVHERESLCVVLGVVAVAPGPSGLNTVPTETLITAWRI